MLQATRLIPRGQGLAPVLLRRAPQLVLDWDLRQNQLMSLAAGIVPDVTYGEAYVN